MRRALAVLLTTWLLAIFPHAAAVDGTLTRTEFRQVKRGDTLADVRRTWDVGHGRCWYFNGEWGLAWKIRGRSTWVTAEFHYRRGAWRLMSKDWNTLFVDFGGCRDQPARSVADTPGCASATEIERVGDTDLSIAQIRRVFDVRGRQVDRGPGTRDRIYPGCGRVIQVWIYYQWRDGAFRWNGSSHTTR
ncbi:hypothetical protein [Nocardioides stalactiti]|uniref:hypothetical protein n=1 Tax=Nocardioides stalactiti TaxID=2755356 RepID=UPI0016045E15|nr:hypothetical protein [Nocardioides stalactiti]